MVLAQGSEVAPGDTAKGLATGVQWVEARDIAQPSAGPRTPPNREPPDPAVSLAQDLAKVRGPASVSSGAMGMLWNWGGTVTLKLGDACAPESGLGPEDLRHRLRQGRGRRNRPGRGTETRRRQQTLDLVTCPGVTGRWRVSRPRGSALCSGTAAPRLLAAPRGVVRAGHRPARFMHAASRSGPQPGRFLVGGTLA